MWQHPVILNSDTCSCASYEEGLHSEQEVFDVLTLMIGVMIMNVSILAIAVLTLWRVRQIERSQYILHAKIQGILDLMTSIRDSVMRFCTKGYIVTQERQVVM
tara:strand:- start:621 stop:929 length:309 start_codon:yes stop_codon:yes gene_type:complete